MAKRKDKFNFRVNEAERAAIERIAKYLQRSASDAVRHVLLMFVEQIAQADSSEQEE